MKNSYFSFKNLIWSQIDFQTIIKKNVTMYFQ